jgi:hypothetical protein
VELNIRKSTLAIPACEKPMRRIPHTNSITPIAQYCIVMLSLATIEDLCKAAAIQRCRDILKRWLAKLE